MKNKKIMKTLEYECLMFNGWTFNFEYFEKENRSMVFVYLYKDENTHLLGNINSRGNREAIEMVANIMKRRKSKFIINAIKKCQELSKHEHDEMVQVKMFAALDMFIHYFVISEGL